MIKTNDIRQFLSTCNHDLLQIILITKYFANVPGVHLLHSSFLLYSNIKKKKTPVTLLQEKVKSRDSQRTTSHFGEFPSSFCFYG